MKFPVTSTATHQGKTLIIDPDRETIEVLDAAGQLLGDVPWGMVIEQVLDGESQDRFAHCRAHPDGTAFDGLTGGIGGGGFFIESSSPLKQGTELSLEFSLPDRPHEQLRAKAKVAWVRNRPERYLLFPGMGVQFVDIDKKTQNLLVNLVEALNRSRTVS
jgi:type IV pilus assembly protein PilZ